MDNPSTRGPDAADVGRRIIRQNLVNLAKKLQAGGTLSTAELALVREAVGGGADVVATSGWAKNQVELAAALGVERKTVQRWMKEDGAPSARSDGRYLVAEWSRWCAEKGKKLNEDDGESQTELRAKQMALQNRKLELQLQILVREYVSVAEVESIGARLGAAVRKVVTSLHLLAPSVAGMDVAECAALLRAKEDEIMDQFQQLADGIEQLKDETGQPTADVEP